MIAKKWKRCSIICFLCNGNSPPSCSVAAVTVIWWGRGVAAASWWRPMPSALTTLALDVSPGSFSSLLMSVSKGWSAAADELAAAVVVVNFEGIEQTAHVCPPRCSPHALKSTVSMGHGWTNRTLLPTQRPPPSVHSRKVIVFYFLFLWHLQSVCLIHQKNTHLKNILMVCAPPAWHLLNEKPQPSSPHFY